jgi:hypothetical protein
MTLWLKFFGAKDILVNLVCIKKQKDLFIPP